VFIKVIISSHTDPAELERSAELARRSQPGNTSMQTATPPCPLQVNKTLGIAAPSPAQVLSWQAAMKDV